MPVRAQRRVVSRQAWAVLVRRYGQESPADGARPNSKDDRRDAPRTGANASRHWEAGVAGPLGTSERPTWRLWARDAAIEKKDILKARGYAWRPGECGRPRCWYRDVVDADKATEVSWLRQNVMGPDQAVWALRITARERYSDRCWAWGESLGIASERAIDRSEGRWRSAMKADIVRGGTE